MNHHSQATNPEGAPTANQQLAVAVAIQQYANSIVERELATTRARWAAHWEYAEEVDAVLEEMATAIARDVLTARVRLAVCGELDAGRIDRHSRARCEQIETLFGCSTAASSNTYSDAADQ